MIQAVVRSSVFALALLGLAQSGADASHEVRQYLTGNGFTAEELARFDEGESIARAMTAGSEEVVAIAAVKIYVPRDRVLDYYGQMISYVDGTTTLAFGRFSTPPAPADVKDLSLDADEVEDLRSCKPGKCDFRLGGVALETLRTTVDWQAADVVDRVNAFARKAAIDYVAAYQARGDAALVTYNDRSKLVSLQQQWRGIVGNAVYFQEYVPELKAYLEQYPGGSVPGARDVLYWVKENYGLKPIISIVHGVIYQPPSRANRAFVVQKQIYASHYYDGSLAVATVLSATENGRPVTYLVYANRSRGDLLRGGFGGVKRNVLQSQARKAAQETLATIKSQLEAVRP